MDESNGTEPQAQDTQRPKAVQHADGSLLPEDQAARVKRYARLLAGHGASAGVFAVVAVTFLADYVKGNSGSRILIIGLFATLFAVAQGFAAVVRYRQLGRYLRCGSASKYEDLIRAAEKPRRPPDT